MRANGTWCLCVVLAAVVLAAAGCGDAVEYYEGDPDQGSVQVSSGGETTAMASGSTQVLYLPVGALPLHLIDRVTVRSDDGQVLSFGRDEIAQAAAGRLAVRLPVGVTTGTVEIEAAGQRVSTTFHIEISMGGSINTGQVGSGSGCQMIAGEWSGTISGNDPRTSSTVVITPLADCRTVHGFVHLEAPGTGSVDSTIDGVWDPGSGRLVARDTQLFNVRAVPGAGFCPTARYDLQLTADGQLVGDNVVTEAACAGTSPVRLQRTRAY